MTMGSPISVHLDDSTQEVLEAAARERGIGLSAYLREMAEREARKISKEKIRAESRAVAEYVATLPEAQAFYADWGTPAVEDGKR
ncbi:uncharacterized protein (DUF1778 family) [Skermanella aerolata]|nr:ribbon-helix-helix protein, CopG family [Skermanella aerolata]